MSESSDPLLVKVLANLCRDWQRSYDRLYRLHRKRKYALVDASKKVALASAKLRFPRKSATVRRLKARYADQIDADARTVETPKYVAVDEAFHLHPYPEIVAQIAELTGLKRERIHKAAAARFSGHRKVVAEIRKLDDREETHQAIQRLYRQLIAEHPTLALKLRLPLEPSSPPPNDGNQKATRRGRKKADYKTEQRESQIAVDWKQARDRGAYKPDFARDKGMTPSEFQKLLNRVAKRKVRLDK
jgi:hypothetical protein